MWNSTHNINNPVSVLCLILATPDLLIYSEQKALNSFPMEKEAVIFYCTMISLFYYSISIIFQI
jgi:hypothetical protein